MEILTVYWGSSSIVVLIMGIVLLGIIIYTFLQLREQTREAEDRTKSSAPGNLKNRYEHGEINREEYEKKKE